MKIFKSKEERQKQKIDKQLSKETIDQLNNRLVKINKEFLEKIEKLEKTKASLVDKELFFEIQQKNDNKLLDLQKSIYDELNSKFDVIVKDLFNNQKEFIEDKNNEIRDLYKNYEEKVLNFEKQLIDFENIKKILSEITENQVSMKTDISNVKLLEGSYKDTALHLIEEKIQSDKLIKEVANQGSRLILDAFSDELSDFSIKEQKTFVEAIKQIFINKNIITTKMDQDTIRQPGELRKEELLHKTYGKVKNTVLAGVIPMVVGPAGSGKSHAMEQIARDLRLNFYMANRIQNTFELVGFVDAAGKYVTTQFYEAYTKGGLFFFDEVDASSPEALVTINAAVAQGHMAFPGHAGNMPMHKDFKAVVAGNTYGTGSTLQYTGRNKLDAATLDRFMVIDWDYDQELENKKIKDKELLEICWVLREVVDKLRDDFNKANRNRDNNPFDSIIISTRGIENLELIFEQEKKTPMMTKEELFKSKFFASAKKEVLSHIFNSFSAKKSITKNNYYSNIEAALKA